MSRKAHPQGVNIDFMHLENQYNCQKISPIRRTSSDAIPPQGKPLLWSPLLGIGCTLSMRIYLAQWFSTLVARKNQVRIRVSYLPWLKALEFVLSFCLGKDHGKLLGKLAFNRIGYKYMCKGYRTHIRKKKRQNPKWHQSNIIFLPNWPECLMTFDM